MKRPLTDYIHQTLVLVTGGYWTTFGVPVTTLNPFLTPISPTFRFHQVQGLTNAEMVEMAILLDPLNPAHVADVLAGNIPGTVPGLWSQPGDAGGGSLSTDSCRDIVRSCVALSGQNGGVCNTVVECVGAPTSGDAGATTVSLEHFADGTYEVDFTIITTYRLKGAGARVFVAISGAPSIDETSFDDTVRTGRIETDITRTVTINGDTPVLGLSWTPTLSFVPGSLGKHVEVDGHIVVTGVRRF